MNSTTVVLPRRGRHGRRTPLWIVALIAAVLGVLVAGTFFVVSGDDKPVIDAKPVGAIAGGLPGDWAAWGFTHTQNSADADPAAQPALARQSTLQAQHIMGFGALNPEPEPGRFSWESLDKRVELIRQTRGVPMLTLCCAPDWMKGGAPGQTDWSHLNDAPTAQNFDAFADLAAAVAKRYPDVKYFVVWNEFKGFFNQKANRWDYEGYTSLYNKVYSALKNVNKDIKVGGPYLVVNSYADPRSAFASTEVKGPWGAADKRALEAVRYWLKKKKGADFVAVDGSTQPEDRKVLADEFAALGKFSAVTRWLKSESGLPVVWPEWYVEPEGGGWTAQRRDAVQAAAMIEFASSGASGALYWSPQGSPNCGGCLWDAGGAALPALDLQQNFARWFKPGTSLMN
ncbi:MAG: xylan 1,4-beta-xylosidase, partial [Streptosporangiaceae bacterium]